MCLATNGGYIDSVKRFRDIVAGIAGRGRTHTVPRKLEHFGRSGRWSQRRLVSLGIRDAPLLGNVRGCIGGGNVAARTGGSTRMDEQTTPDALTMFSFEEIVSEIELKRKAARTGIDSWDRLHAVASELAGASASDESWQAADRTWLLEQVSIHNYRGVSNEHPLTLVFDPTPGITVLHGLNGAGKSSVSDAIELGLTGSTPLTLGGTAGKAALWEPVHLARGSSSARVEVTLASKDERLILETRLGPRGTVESHTAFLETADGRKMISLDASWQQALASHQPVFAYAALERRVQLSKDLATYFEGLLALGGSFAAIQETIADRGNTSREALDRWRVAKDEAMRSMSRIDDDRLGDKQLVPLQPVPEPVIGEDRDTWLSNAGLLESGLNSDSLPSGTKARLFDSATRVQKSILRLEQAGTISEQMLSEALEQLHTEAKDRHIENGTCPVCATPDSNWLATLEQAVERNRNVSALRREVAADTKSLAAVGEELLDAVLRVGALAPIDDPIMGASSIGRQLLNKFNSARDSGTATQHSVLTATSELSRWLCSQEASTLIGEAVARTDAIKQWRIARSRAVEDFVSVWKTEGLSAAESVLWTNTSKRVEDIRSQLRKKRSISLEGKAGARVKELLADAELQLKSISVLSTKASMELIDQNGSRVDLGMLSAGQRNAVLLAPLLASVDAGPFGFLILDDPVHAFDELRVDRLADSLAKLAETRRVVVLTHDDRLKENLAARTIECDTRLVDRSAVTGSVQITDSSHFWDQLLTDAGRVYDLAIAETGSARDVTASIRGLCRISIDNALRTFTLRNAALSARDTAADLEELDKAYTTEQRLDAAAKLWEGSSWDNPVARAISECEPHLVLWNQAVHGNSQMTDASRLEIKAARKACKALVAAA
jgi:energy-coupling factor transporter ATP-binding protein EcfA2